MVEPFYSAAKAQGLAGRSATYADVAPNLCVALYFTSTKLANENPDLVQRFTEAMKESLAYADANPDEARRIIGTYTQITEEVRNAMTLPKWPAEINRDVDHDARRPGGHRRTADRAARPEHPAAVTQAREPGALAAPPWAGALGERAGRALLGILGLLTSPSRSS